MNPRWYEELTRQAQETFVRGDLEQACSYLQQAEEKATAHDLEELSYQAFCRRCDVLICLDRISERDEVRRLKEILLRSKQPRTRWMAAYYTAVAYFTAVACDVLCSREKALPYARRSAELAEEVGNPNDTASSVSLLGNLALVSSEFGEAEQAYRLALDIYESSGSSFEALMLAQLRNSLGYTCLCNGRLEEGIELCEQAREVMEQLDAKYYLHEPLQDLCYGYLLCDRLVEAEACGLKGLALALRSGDNLVAKNLYYLLAEVAVRSGDKLRARYYLSELSRFYPEIPCSEEIVELLMGMDFTQVVNLRG
jgi:tetratricopeptide (TPR) repeat protein